MTVSLHDLCVENNFPVSFLVFMYIYIYIYISVICFSMFPDHFPLKISFNIKYFALPYPIDSI